MNNLSTAVQLGELELANAQLKRSFRIVLALLAGVKSGEVNPAHVTIDEAAMTFAYTQPAEAKGADAPPPPLKITVVEEPETPPPPVVPGT